MALAKCRECGAEVSTEAKACPHCGVANPAPRKPMSAGCTVVLVLAAVLFVGWCASLSAPSSPNATAPSHKFDDPVEAKIDGYTACNETVLQSLKAPSTADVSGLEDTFYDRKGDVISFRGTVDAQNSFGAKLRAVWTCRFRVYPDSLHALAFHLYQPGQY